MTARMFLSLWLVAITLIVAHAAGLVWWLAFKLFGNPTILLTGSYFSCLLLGFVSWLAYLGVLELREGLAKVFTNATLQDELRQRAQPPSNPPSQPRQPDLKWEPPREK